MYARSTHVHILSVILQLGRERSGDTFSSFIISNNSDNERAITNLYDCLSSLGGAMV